MAVACTSAVSHPNVVRSLGWTTSPELCLVQEYLHGLSLYSQLYVEMWVPSLKQVLKAALDVATGMEYLHTAFDLPVIHRDLKSGNLMLTQMPTDDEEVVVKITDFGLTRESHTDGHAMTVSTAGGTAGTVLWMAPEILQGVAYNEKVDVYSYAMCLVELVDCKLPWNGVAIGAEVSHRVTKNDRPDRQLRKLMPESGASPSEFLLKDLIVSCWHVSPERRPAMAEIVTRLRAIQAGRPDQVALTMGGRAQPAVGESRPSSPPARGLEAVVEVDGAG